VWAPGSSHNAAVTTVLVLVTLGLVGTATDLWFLAHTEDSNQFIPFVVIAFAVTSLGWWLATRGGPSVRAVQLAMVLLVIAGVIGVVLHYRANMEFQLESDPSLGGLALMMKVLQAKAPPAFAPMNLALLGLIGLAAVSKERG
jgi:hypothetical protein